MAHHHGYKADNTGLVFAIDYFNHKCYTSGSSYIHDISHYGTTGSLENGPLAGPLGWEFDGTDAHILFQTGSVLVNNASGEINSIDVSTPFTIEAWAKCNNGVIVANGGADDAQPWSRGFSFACGGANERPVWQFRKANNDRTYTYGTPGTAPNDVWHYFVGTHDGTANPYDQTVKYYVDGALITQAADNIQGTTDDIKSQNPMLIGAGPATNAPAPYPAIHSYFTGSISVVKIYKNRVFTATEVSNEFERLRSRYGI